MPSLVPPPQPSRIARRILRAALHLASLGVATSIASAQDASAAARPLTGPVAPATKDSARKDAVKVSAPTTPPAVAVAATTPAPAPRVAAPSVAPTATPAGSAADVAAPQAELANAYVQRAISLYELGRDDEAIAQYRKGIANDPLDSDTWYGLADLLHELGRDKQAIETYTLALTTIEHAPELRLPFAELLMANHRKPEAIKVLQRGIELDPEYSAELKTMLGNVVLGVLDDSMPVATVNGSAKVAAPVKAKARVDRKKRKKLCKLFCPGTLDPAVPKP
jgi:tetratricopeptide (TPR) repeat protein